MKAIQVNQFGGPEVLQLKDIELPEPDEGQVKVRLKAAGLNFTDIYHRRGEYPLQPPFTPGFEGAGVVEAVGKGVKDFKRGDRVAYTSQLGAYAEASIVEANSLIPLPDNLSFEQGAAFPLQGITAHYLVHEYRQIKPNETVLIHAAAGGMGLLLVQWFKYLGARVIGTVSTEEKAKVAREAGADDVILYTERDFVSETKRLTEGRGAELIIDGVGKTTFAGNLEAVAIRGHIVLYGAASGQADPISPHSLVPLSFSVSGGHLFNYTQTREELLYRAKGVLNGISEGWLRLRIEHELPLSRAAEAHRLLEDRKSVGKIILRTEA